MITYLLVGGNLGDKEENLLTASTWIKSRIGDIKEQSSIYETDAWGVTDQPSFLNQVIGIETDLSAFEVLDEIQEIELLMGRKRKRKWGERIIDIDILFYENEIIETQRLTIPHPGIPNRNFVLTPMMEIAPKLEHPVLKKTIESLSLACPDKLQVRQK